MTETLTLTLFTKPNLSHFGVEGVLYFFVTNRCTFYLTNTGRSCRCSYGYFVRK